jgi:hypothetical protein
MSNTPTRRRQWLLRKLSSRAAVAIAVAATLDFGATSLAAQVEDPPAGASSMDWSEHMLSGRTFRVVLDRVPRGCDQLGTLQPGATYSVEWRRGTFYCTGFNRGADRVGQWAYSNGDPSKNQISLWGRVVIFDGDGNVFDAACGRIGHLALKSRPDTSPPAARPSPSVRQAVPPSIPPSACTMDAAQSRPDTSSPAPRPSPPLRPTVHSPDPEIDQMMDEVRKGGSLSFDSGPLALRVAREPGAVVDALVPFMDDAEYGVRDDAKRIIHVIGSRSDDKGLRRRVVQALSVVCAGDNQEEEDASSACARLTSYGREDFSSVAKANVALPIKRGRHQADQVNTILFRPNRRRRQVDVALRLAGYLGMRELTPDIRRIIASTKPCDYTHWAAHLCWRRRGTAGI